MKIENAVKKLEKAGFVKEARAGPVRTYYKAGCNRIISFHAAICTNGDSDIFTINVRRSNNEDYSLGMGSFFPNLSKAIKFATAA